MSKLSPKFVWICFAVVVVVALAVLALNRISAGITASVEHKSAKTATGTVTSTTEVQRRDSQNANSDDHVYKVCFTVDDFDQVEPEMRQGYQSSEAQRLTIDGPRCKVTTKAALAKRLNKGDKVSVVYLLENQYQIDVVGIAAFGEDL